jgi:creatinine amidohydrolase/Fe(II)-dependent formamide hydrolase-like protein
MRTALEAVQQSHPIAGHMMMEGDLTDFGEHRMDHAAHWETSILMYLLPDCVDMHQIREEPIGPVDWEHMDWKSPGISGKDPRGGSANKELGRMLVEGMANAIGTKARELLAGLGKAGLLSQGPPPGGLPPPRR